MPAPQESKQESALAGMLKQLQQSVGQTGAFVANLYKQMQGVGSMMGRMTATALITSGVRPVRSDLFHYLAGSGGGGGGGGGSGGGSSQQRLEHDILYSKARAKAEERLKTPGEKDGKGGSSSSDFYATALSEYEKFLIAKQAMKARYDAAANAKYKTSDDNLDFFDVQVQKYKEFLDKKWELKKKDDDRKKTAKASPGLQDEAASVSPAGALKGSQGKPPTPGLATTPQTSGAYFDNTPPDPTPATTRFKAAMASGDLVNIDTETTDVIRKDPVTGKPTVIPSPLSIGAVRIRRDSEGKETREEFERFMMPPSGESIHPEATAQHGMRVNEQGQLVRAIKDDQGKVLREEVLKTTPRRRVAQELDAFLAGTKAIGGHNYEDFDRQVLRRSQGKAGLKLPEDALTYDTFRVGLEQNLGEQVGTPTYTNKAGELKHSLKQSALVNALLPDTYARTYGAAAGQHGALSDASANVDLSNALNNMLSPPTNAGAGAGVPPTPPPPVATGGMPDFSGDPGPMPELVGPKQTEALADAAEKTTEKLEGLGKGTKKLSDEELKLADLDRKKLKESGWGRAHGELSHATLAGTALAAGALGAGAPDAFSTLTGSAKLLAAALGQTLIPAAMQLSVGLQDLAIGFHGMSSGAKETVGNIAKWTLILGVGGLATTKILATVGTALQMFGIQVSVATARSMAFGAALVAGTAYLALQTRAGMEDMANKLNAATKKGENIPGYVAAHPGEFESEKLKKVLEWGKEAAKADPKFGPADQIEALKEYKKSPDELVKLRRKDLDVVRDATEEFPGDIDALNLEKATMNRLMGPEAAKEAFKTHMQTDEKYLGWANSPKRAALQQRLIETGESPAEYQASRKELMTLNEGRSERAKQEIEVLTAKLEGRKPNLPTPLELTKEEKEQRNMKGQLLLASFSSMKGQASYSSVDEAYKRIQLGALQDDPLTAMTMKWQRESLALQLKDMEANQETAGLLSWLRDYLSSK